MQVFKSSRNTLKKFLNEADKNFINFTKRDFDNYEKHLLKIKSYATSEVLSDINVWGFIQLADSSIVALTTRGEGLYHFDKNFNQLPSKFNLALCANANSWVNIRCGVRDKNNHLWVGCEKRAVVEIVP